MHKINGVLKLLSVIEGHKFKQTNSLERGLRGARSFLAAYDTGAGASDPKTNKQTWVRTF